MIELSLSESKIDEKLNQILIEFFGLFSNTYEKEIVFLKNNTINENNIYEAEGDYYILSGDALKYYYFKGVYLYCKNKIKNGGMNSFFEDLVNLKNGRYIDFISFEMEDFEKIERFIEKFDPVADSYYYQNKFAVLSSLVLLKSQIAKHKNEKISPKSAKKLIRRAYATPIKPA